MGARMQSLIDEEAASIAARIRHTANGDWLTRYDPGDEEFMPAAMHMTFLRMGIITPDGDPRGGYMLSALGLAIVEELRA